VAEATDDTDWTPYGSRIAFEVADFIYRRNQMSAGNFGMLCELWAATLLPHGDTPPFLNYDELCQTIDKTPVGGVAWESFKLSYSGSRPDDVPSWMENEHEIWYRDPRLLFKNMLANPEFQDFFDYAPLRQFDAHGDRKYENLMSGDWAWNQAVSDFRFSCPDVHRSIVANVFSRILFRRILTRMVHFLSQSYLGVIKRQFLLQPATLNTGHFMLRSATCIMVLDEHMVQD
jgi:hypothetical protein